MFIIGSILYIIHSWATNRAIGDAIADVKIGINIYQWCRDICSWTLINGPPILLGGAGAIYVLKSSLRYLKLPEPGNVDQKMTH